MSPQFGIRVFHIHDIGPLAEAVWESMPDLEPWLPVGRDGYTVADSANWVLSRPPAWATGSEFNFVVYEVSNGALVGSVGLNAINPTHRFANLAYWVRSSWVRRGAATSGARLAARFGFDVLRLQRIEMLIEPGNVASHRVAQKLGATREGLLRNRLLIRGHGRDAVLYSLVREENGSAAGSMAPATDHDAP
jgi:ribosomal-protein-serine acetyltransferase